MDGLRSPSEQHLLGSDPVESTRPLEQILGYDPSDEVTRSQAYCLYLSHLLSTWNSRMYEFGVILFTQAAFPGDLAASSFNGFSEAICVLFLSSALGRWVDCAPSRLHTLLLTISVNRISGVISCILWLLILVSDDSTYKKLLFAVVLVLAVVEKLSRLTNTLSMERDWVPTIAPPALKAKAQAPFGLTHLNTVMRRIDLVCKLLAPLAVSTFISTIAPVNIAAIVIAIISLLSWGVEWWGVTRVWNQSGRLRMPKELLGERPTSLNSDTSNQSTTENTLGGSWARMRALAPVRFLISIFTTVKSALLMQIDSLLFYFSTIVWIPSIGIAILHTTVLSYTATLLVYLLNAGFSLKLITVARAVGSMFELFSSFFYPWAVDKLSSRRNRHASYSLVDGHTDESVMINSRRSCDGETGANSSEISDGPITWQITTGVARVGLLGIGGIFLSLTPVMVDVFYIDHVLSTSTHSSYVNWAIINSTASPSPPLAPPSVHPAATVVLFAFLTISLTAHWVYDLSTTQLTQTLIPASRRANFGGTEISLISCLSVLRWAAPVIWHEQSDFKWLALGSFVLVGIGAVAYGGWLRWLERREESPHDDKGRRESISDDGSDGGRNI